MVEAYQRLYGFELIIVRLANVYGVGHFAGGSAGGEMVQTFAPNRNQGRRGQDKPGADPRF